jgi:hypothetical protein
MLHTPHRGRRWAAGLATLSALAFAAPASAADFTNACKNSVEPNNYSQIGVNGMTATIPASVPPSTNFSITDIKGTAKIPGTVFVAGYNLGLVHDGDTLDGTVQMTIEGVNTTQQIQTTPEVPVKIGPVHINDPDGEPATGDETSEDADVPFALPDETWTSGAGEGTMTFSEVPVTPIASTKGGLLLTASIPTSGNPLVVKFGCNPGTVDEEQNKPNGVPTYVESAAPFATSAIAKDAPPPPPPTGVAPPAGGPPGGGTNYGGVPANTFTFGKVKLNKKKGTAKLPVLVPGEGPVVLSKGKVVGREVIATGAQKITLTIKARKKALKKLNKKGKVKVKVRVSFTPTGGTKLTKSKKITLKKTVKHKKHKK